MQNAFASCICIHLYNLICACKADRNRRPARATGLGEGERQKRRAEARVYQQKSPDAAAAAPLPAPAPSPSVPFTLAQVGRSFALPSLSLLGRRRPQSSTTMAAASSIHPSFLLPRTIAIDPSTPLALLPEQPRSTLASLNDVARNFRCQGSYGAARPAGDKPGRRAVHQLAVAAAMNLKRFF